jgi:hypothetical protein
MTELREPGGGERYLEIKDLIKALEAEKKDIAKTLKVGERVTYKGDLYEWIAYETGSTAWKPLYERAYGMLDDEAQVIMGEAVEDAKKPRIDHKFEKKS